MKKIISYSFTGFLMFNVSCHAISTNFIARGFKNCTGYCEAGKINCQRGINKQGYYDWCSKNCTHDSKTNLQVFLDGIKSCETKNINSQTQQKAQTLQNQTQNYNNNYPSSNSNHGGKDTQSVPTPTQQKAQTLQNQTQNYNNSSSSYNHGGK